MSAAWAERRIRGASLALLSRAVRGRDERGAEWGEAMLREFPETCGAQEAVRWTASGLRVALRERRGRGQRARRPLTRRTRLSRRMIVTALTVTVAGVLINQFVLGLAPVASTSMEPSLRVSDRVLVDRLGFRLSHLNRGDVVLFRQPGDATSLQRVVGLPGDLLSCAGGRLHRNGVPAEEQYLRAGAEVVTDCEPVTVPEGAVYVMGDDRAISRDSRTYGPVSDGDVTGRVVTRLWPLG
ncbi:signal peptidase I [Micromonospora sp. NBC_01796]|uniref:signal peptidase I n=1 Tax=Micromonospora sp. NBC_01796 TaxID=2975987 RepID=UPI002DD9E5DA|nr:signal peptidase I [Micromonospora sp. NBC_01796]WSA83828.1 signal peptidase I [Micromonospora sp. NBC_01796]